MISLSGRPVLTKFHRKLTGSGQYVWSRSLLYPSACWQPAAVVNSPRPASSRPFTSIPACRSESCSGGSLGGRSRPSSGCWKVWRPPVTKLEESEVPSETEPGSRRSFGDLREKNSDNTEEEEDPGRTANVVGDEDLRPDLGTSSQASKVGPCYSRCYSASTKAEQASHGSPNDAGLPVGDQIQCLLPAHELLEEAPARVGHSACESHSHSHSHPHHHHHHHHHRSRSRTPLDSFHSLRVKQTNRHRTNQMSPACPQRQPHEQQQQQPPQKSRQQKKRRRRVREGEVLESSKSFGLLTSADKDKGDTDNVLGDGEEFNRMDNHTEWQATNTPQAGRCPQLMGCRRFSILVCCHEIAHYVCSSELGEHVGAPVHRCPPTSRALLRTESLSSDPQPSSCKGRHCSQSHDQPDHIVPTESP
ncbi:unnamed protein product [Protopolystoma xenopodis]|uniref:Uncharacterized protein n=1 Tax=Protopolystoma xenopodis TaxID=117903 RepID=A0A3S5AYQ1_9PLAT|nr:unnamed protein product [Protopolystoma xenopodis]